MEDLIRALQIFLKYGNHKYPTWCEHDCLHVCGIAYDDVSGDDRVELEELGFFWDTTEEGFMSYRFGSA